MKTGLDIIYLSVFSLFLNRVNTGEQTVSTQVSAMWSYAIDGTYKEYAYDNTTMNFKRTTNYEYIKQICKVGNRDE